MKTNRLFDWVELCTGAPMNAPVCFEFWMIICLLSAVIGIWLLVETIGPIWSWRMKVKAEKLKQLSD
jgi:uncharacterized Tic20 family protein